LLILTSKLRKGNGLQKQQVRRSKHGRALSSYRFATSVLVFNELSDKLRSVSAGFFFRFIRLSNVLVNFWSFIEFKKPGLLPAPPSGTVSVTGTIPCRAEVLSSA
jgi:hypothetical protein